MTTKSEFEDTQFIDSYPEGVENYFWSIARNKILSRTLSNAASQGLRSNNDRILEIGCGPGVVVHGLRKRGHDVWGVDLGTPQHAVAGTSDYINFGTIAQSLDEATRNSFETIMLLDVIEHIEADAQFVREILDAFPACKCVIVTVPARPEVWSAWDDYYGHYRRYTPTSLLKSLDSAGLNCTRPEYMFRALYIAAWLINKVPRGRSVSLKPPKFLLLHKIVAMGMVVEHILFRRLPVRGLSLLVVCAR